jgi:hypothetical protein
VEKKLPANVIPETRRGIKCGRVYSGPIHVHLSDSLQRSSPMQRSQSQAMPLLVGA